MLCEVNALGNFWITWLVTTALGLIFILVMSGTIFYYYYQHPTYQKWIHKSNPLFPSLPMVQDEIIQTAKGMATATLCPALTLYLAQHGYSQAYCGTHQGQYGLLYHVATFMLLWISVDFWEFFYHYLGHTTKFGWQQHRHHHQFYNPSPFAVIADEYIDQFVRSAPLLLFPIIMPINIDMMFFQFGIFFYGYGVYLHWGYEMNFPDAHHPIINSSFQHYLHHSKSIINKPYHTGFFFKTWDQLFGSVYKGACFCAKCEREQGLRSEKHWLEAIKSKPDYSPLLSVSAWAKFLTSSDQAEATKSN